MLDGDLQSPPVMDVRRGVLNLSARLAHCDDQVDFLDPLENDPESGGDRIGR